MEQSYVDILIRLGKDVKKQFYNSCRWAKEDRKSYLSSRRIVMEILGLISRKEKINMPQNKFANDADKTLVQSTIAEMHENNDQNLSDNSDKYAQGYHDALLELSKRLGLPMGDREYFDWFGGRTRENGLIPNS